MGYGTYDELAQEFKINIENDEIAMLIEKHRQVQQAKKEEQEKKG
jgi:hypothetical protein